MSNELPVVQSEPRERADAARNRTRILCTAARLFEERGVDRVSMEDVAVAAGVGKGTVFRRFGDRAGLARAILGEADRQFQEELIRGAPPLGPGAPACQRLIAFGCGMLDLLEGSAPLMAAAEGGLTGARWQSGVHAFYWTHVRNLIDQADAGVDAGYVADVLLAGLGAHLFLHMRRARERDLADLKHGWTELARRLVEAQPVDRSLLEPSVV